MKQTYLLVAVAGMFLSGCASLSEHSTGLNSAGLLKDCPKAPRCVASQRALEGRVVEPLVLVSADDAVWTELVRVLDTQERTQVVEQADRYVRAEVTSPWGVYIDDVELLCRADGKTVDIRSTGRIGWYDFDVNADRVAALKQAWREAGVLAP